MAEANLVNKKVMMSNGDIIKYQLLTQCFLDNIRISPTELKCLTLLGIFGKCPLALFCNSAVNNGVFKTSQTVRNFLTKAEKNNLVIKSGAQKIVELNPKFKIQTEGNIILNYKFYYVVTKEQ